MTVAELISILREYSGDMQAAKASDAEGNAFTGISEVESSVMYIGEGELSAIHPDDEWEYDSDEKERMVVLW